MNARAKRGLYNGGCVPFGYSLIKGKSGYLDVNEKQAEIVRKAFKVFLKEETLSKTAKWLNTNGYRLKRAMSGGGRNMRLDYFTVDNLHHILRSKTYIGMRSYKEKGKTKYVKAVMHVTNITNFFKVTCVLIRSLKVITPKKIVVNGSWCCKFPFPYM